MSKYSELAAVAEAQSQAKAGEQPEVEQVEEETEAVEAEGLLSQETETEQETVPDDDSEAVETDELPESITLQEVAEAYAVPIEEVYNKISIGLSDGSGDISLGKLKDMAQDVIRKSGELDQLEQERLAVRQQAEALQAQTTNLTQLPETFLEADAAFRSITAQLNNAEYWQQAEQADAGKAALDHQRLMAAQQQAYAQRTEALTQHQQTLDGQAQERRVAEAKKLVGLIPEWKDQERMTKDYQAISDWVDSRGYSGKSVIALEDAGAMKFIHDLWKDTQTLQAADVVKKKVKKAPLSLKSGARKDPVPETKKLKSIIDRAHKPGARRNDKDAAYIALGRALKI